MSTGVPGTRAETWAEADRDGRTVAAGAGAALLQLCTEAQERLGRLEAADTAAAASALRANVAGALRLLRGGERLAETLLAFGGAQTLAAVPLDAAELLASFARMLQPALCVVCKRRASRQRLVTA